MKNMKNRKHAYLYASITMLALFALWTALVSLIDVAPIGPLGSRVGFSTLNSRVYALTGVHFPLYTLTDWLGLVPILTVLCFAALGLFQWGKRKRLSRVDRSLFVLGEFYCAVMATFVFFEVIPINYRPVLIDGVLEASYPSSTTMLVMCVMPTAILQLRSRIHSSALKRVVTLTLSAFTAFMVVGRLFSGVHWLTDIIGGVLVSAGLVLLYVYYEK